MPAAAKRKLEAALPPAVDDGPRAALAAAISAHAEAQKAVELKQQTVRRALDGIGAAEKKLEKCRAACCGSEGEGCQICGRSSRQSCSAGYPVASTKCPFGRRDC